MKMETDLAASVAAYFQELQGRNLSSELVEQLTRDYQQARLAALYGGPQAIFINPCDMSDTVREKLIANLQAHGIGKR